MIVEAEGMSSEQCCRKIRYETHGNGHVSLCQSSGNRKRMRTRRRKWACANGYHRFVAGRETTHNGLDSASRQGFGNVEC